MTYFQTAVSIVIIFALVIVFIGVYTRNRYAIQPLSPIEEDNNMDRQRAYIAKRISMSASQTECDYIEALIDHYDITFIDAPEIKSEVDEMKDELQMQRNYLAAISLQTTLQR